MNANAIRILSRLPDEEFIDREAELARVCSLAQTGREGPPRGSAGNVLMLGAPRVGKSEILRKRFDRLFNMGGKVIPIYYALRRSCLDPETFAGDYFAQFLAQFVAFKSNDPGLISIADEPLSVIARAAPPEDYRWARSMVDSFQITSRSEEPSRILRFALSCPAAI